MENETLQPGQSEQLPENTPAPKTPAELLLERIETTAAQLEARDDVKAKVHPILFYNPKDTEKADPVIGYIKEPPRAVKIRVLDKGVQLGDFAASSEMLDLCLIKDASDHRIYSERAEHDFYYLGACNEAQKIIQIALSQFKKK
jgi:hypothetical protein